MKERIIGAVVLVVVVVLIVPVFLDGPPGDGEIVSQRVLLPGQERQDTKTVVLNRGRSEPIPVASGSQGEVETSSATDAEPTVTTPNPDADQAFARDQQDSVTNARSTVAEAPASTTGMWAVQLGSFSNKLNAERLAADLRKQGYAAFLSQLKASSGPLHRVRVGPQKDRESAEAMAARLLKINHKGQVVPHP